jgi:hypothetical protein
MKVGPTVECGALQNASLLKQPKEDERSDASGLAQLLGVERAAGCRGGSAV